MKFFLLVFLSCSFLCCSVFAQPLSGIAPKYDSYQSITAISLQWNAVNNAVDYQVEISQDPNFISGVIQSGSVLITNWTTPILTFGDWYWRVQANLPVGNLLGQIEKFTVFDPSQISYLSCWLDAGQGVVLDGSSQVQSWQDQSSNNLVVSQSNLTARPGIFTSTLNGKPSLTFSGDDFLDGGDILDLRQNNRSMFLVGKSNGTTPQCFFAKSIAAGAVARYALYGYLGDAYFLYHDGGYVEINTPSPVSSEFGLYNVLCDRGASINSLNVNNQIPVTGGPVTWYDLNSDFRFLVGAYNGNPDNSELSHLNGEISEIIFTDGPINATDNAKINNYLRDKYVAPLDLGKDIVISDTYCDTTLIASAGFTNHVWSTGETTPTIAVNQDGLYWCQATDLFGFVHYDTIQVSFPVISNPSPTIVCAGQSTLWDTGLGGSFTYLWSTGETSETISVSSAGTYSVVVTDAFGCSKAGAPVAFSLDNYSSTVWIGNDTTLCSGNSIYLQTGVAQTVTYLWTGGSTSPTLPITMTGTYDVETTNANGCIARDTINVTVSGVAPVPDFSSTAACFGSPNDLTDLSTSQPTDPIMIWDWDLGDGNSAATQNPSYAYANAGTYTVQLYVETVGGCGASQSHTVTVFDPPYADFDHTGNCSADAVQFMDQTTVGSSTIAAWLWNFGQPSSGLQNVSVVNSPTKIYNEVGTFPVYFQVTDNNGCTDDTTVNVTLVASPTASFTASDACENMAVPFTNASVGGFTYSWNFGDATTSILPNPSHTYTSYGAKTVLLIATAANGCTASFQDQVYIHPVPIPAIGVGPLCSDTYVPFMDQSFLPEGSIASSMWVVNGQDTVYGLTTGYQFDATGQQEIILTTTSAAGCTASVNQFVDPQVMLNAGFDSGSGVLAANEPFTFLNTTTNPASSNWDFGDGSVSFTDSPAHEYISYWTDSTVMVTLVVSNALGCTDTVQHLLQIRPSRLDLALTNLYLQNNNGFYSLGVQLKNEGSVTINSADLVVVLPQGPAVSETWTGSLQPGMTTIYVFNSQPNAFVSTENATDDFICVEGLGHDDAGTVEVALSNNKICRNTEGEQVVLLPVYPNPASDEVTVQVLVSVSSEVTLDLTDSRGRLVKTMLPTQTLGKGMYSCTIDLKQVEAGTYFVRMVSGDQEVMMKLMVM